METLLGANVGLVNLGLIGRIHGAIVAVTVGTIVAVTIPLCIRPISRVPCEVVILFSSVNIE